MRWVNKFRLLILRTDLADSCTITVLDQLTVIFYKISIQTESTIYKSRLCATSFIAKRKTVTFTDALHSAAHIATCRQPAKIK